MTPTTTTATDATGTSVSRLRPRHATTRRASSHANTGTTVTTLRPLPPHDPDPVPDRDREADPPQGTVRIELSDGRVLFGTMIRDYRPAFTDEDYAVLARCRDELRASAAARTAAGDLSAAA